MSINSNLAFVYLFILYWIELQINKWLKRTCLVNHLVKDFIPTKNLFKIQKALMHQRGMHYLSKSPKKIDMLCFDVIEIVTNEIGKKIPIDNSKKASCT